MNTSEAIAVGGASSSRARLIEAVWRDNRAFLAIVGTYVVGSAIARSVLGGSAVGTLFWLSKSTIMAGYFVVISVVIERLHHPSIPARTAYRDAWRTLRNDRLSNRRLIGGFLVLVAMAFMLATFTWWKVRIPVTHPFSWDATFAGWDAALHGGRHPWEWLHPLIGHPTVTKLIDRGYGNLWSAALALSVVWYAFARPSLRRTQFLVTFAVAWPLLGNVIAAMLSSAGPCYYHLVVSGPSPYDGLLAHIRETSVGAIRYQDMLWAIYTGADKDMVGSGISAMPSLHIATATLVALATWPSRWRIAGIAFVVFMLIGSVHLGWHYAIDGYFAIVLTVGLWFAVGAVCKRFATATDSRGQPVG